MAKKKPPVDLTFALGGSNVLTAGDSTNATTDELELVYSGAETEVPKVTVTVVEIDEDETIDQSKPGKNEVVAEFTGKITGGAFETEKSNIKTAKLPDTTPHINLSIGGKSFSKVKLPGAAQENALFELGVVVTSGGATY